MEGNLLELQTEHSCGKVWSNCRSYLRGKIYAHACRFSLTPRAAELNTNKTASCYSYIYLTMCNCHKAVVQTTHRTVFLSSCAPQNQDLLFIHKQTTAMWTSIIPACPLNLRHAPPHRSPLQASICRDTLSEGRRSGVVWHPQVYGWLLSSWCIVHRPYLQKAASISYAHCSGQMNTHRKTATAAFCK